MQVLCQHPLCFEIEEKLFLSEGRSDVMFFYPSYLEADNLLVHKGFVRFGELIKRIRKGIFDLSPTEYRDVGIPFIRISNIKEGELNEDSLVFINNETNKKNENTIFRPGDLVISKVGTVDSTIVLPDKYPEYNISQNVIGVELKDRTQASFIYIFLSSKFGMLQLQRFSASQVQAKLTLENIKDVKIPLLSKSIQEKIVKLTENAKNKYKQNLKEIQKLTRELNNFFVKELGLRYREEKKESIFTADLEDRLDPHYYNPKFSKVIEILKRGKFEFRKLKELVRISDEQIDPSQEPNRLFKYVQIQNVDATRNKIISYQPVLGKNAPGRARMLIKEGDILLPGLGGSFKSVAVVPTGLNGEIASNGFIILRTKDKNLRFFVFKFLTTPFAFLQLEKKLSGAIMASISKDDVENVRIPLPDVKTLSRIATKINTTNKQIERLKVDAEHIIQKCKEEVECLILGRK